MSAIPQRGPHVRDLFSKAGPSVNLSSLEDGHQESRSSYELSGKKKHPAPPPPVSLGQYKPRILSDNDDVVNIAVNRGGSGPVDSPPSVNGHGPDPAPSGKAKDAKPIVMGDKDTPLLIPSSSGDSGLEPNVRDLSVTTNSQADGLVIATSNPLFDAQLPKANGHVPVANGKVPHYVKKKDQKRVEQHQEPEGVFIPPPDYDEEEKTMYFSDDDEEEVVSEKPVKTVVYKEYLGEDFSAYLSDDDSGLRIARQRQNRPSPAGDRKSKTEVKRSPQYKKRVKASGKDRKDTDSCGSGSLRSFSYADSKFGTISRNDNRRLSVHSLPENNKEAEMFVSAGSSYERFLRHRSGEELNFFEAEMPQVPQRYAGPSHKKDTLWKRLTWRFKKQPKNGFNVEH